MRRGDWAAAFAVNDAVLAGRDPTTRDDPALPYHLRWVWDGTPPDGQDVLVRCYHGLGDTLQFSRYLPILARRARSVTVEAQPELLPLLALLPAPLRLLPFRPAQPARPQVCEAEIMELAHVLRSGPDTAPPCRPDIPADRTAAARRRFGSGVTGLCWEAGGWDPDRSVPLPDLARALDGVPLAMLQRGPAAEQAGAPGAPAFLNPQDRSTEIVDAAAAVAALDRVVTVDTMVAHLAGTMGQPTLLLLKRDADWRWMTGANTVWYPSVTPLRQDRDGDWAGPLRALRARLAVSA